MNELILMMALTCHGYLGSAATCLRVETPTKTIIQFCEVGDKVPGTRKHSFADARGDYIGPNGRTYVIIQIPCGSESA